jgi:hypothetical protein
MSTAALDGNFQGAQNSTVNARMSGNLSWGGPDYGNRVTMVR